MDRGGEFNFFQGAVVRINRWLISYDTYDHRICQPCTSTGFDSNQTNQAGAGDLITSRSSDKLKVIYLDYHSAYGTKLG